MGLVEDLLATDQEYDNERYRKGGYIIAHLAFDIPFIGAKWTQEGYEENRLGVLMENPVDYTIATDVKFLCENLVINHAGGAAEEMYQQAEAKVLPENERVLLLTPSDFSKRMNNFERKHNIPIERRLDQLGFIRHQHNYREMAKEIITENWDCLVCIAKIVGSINGRSMQDCLEELRAKNLSITKYSFPTQ